MDIDLQLQLHTRIVRSVETESCECGCSSVGAARAFGSRTAVWPDRRVGTFFAPTIGTSRST